MKNCHEIEPNDYLSEQRQEELVKKIENGFPMVALRQAIREAVFIAFWQWRPDKQLEELSCTCEKPDSAYNDDLYSCRTCGKLLLKEHIR